MKARSFLEQNKLPLDHRGRLEEGLGSILAARTYLLGTPAVMSLLFQNGKCPGCGAPPTPGAPTQRRFPESPPAAQAARQLAPGQCHVVAIDILRSKQDQRNILGPTRYGDLCQAAAEGRIQAVIEGPMARRGRCCVSHPDPDKLEVWWFQYKVTRQNCPWAFLHDDPQRCIAALELLLLVELVHRQCEDLRGRRLRVASEPRQCFFLAGWLCPKGAIRIHPGGDCCTTPDSRGNTVPTHVTHPAPDFNPVKQVKIEPRWLILPEILCLVYPPMAP